MLGIGSVQYLDRITVCDGYNKASNIGISHRNYGKMRVSTTTLAILKTTATKYNNSGLYICGQGIPSL